MARKWDLSWLTNWRVLLVCGGTLFAGFLLGMLVFGSPWHLPPAWGDIPTWITAIATAGLLVGAIVTAIYAIRAFRGQADMLKVQSEQLDEQRKINVLQALDLGESLRERERLRRVAEREQANAVGFAWWPGDHVLTHFRPDMSKATVLVIENASRHRILNAACRIEPAEGAGLTLAAEAAGQLEDARTDAHRATLLDVDKGGTIPLIRPGSRYGFIAKFDIEKQPKAHLAIRFTDDAGLHWQIDHDLHLEKLNNRDAW